jgi:hypothetical protein
LEGLFPLLLPAVAQSDLYEKQTGESNLPAVVRPCCLGLLRQCAYILFTILLLLAAAVPAAGCLLCFPSLGLQFAYVLLTILLLFAC